jgi:hypothetical protein
MLPNTSTLQSRPGAKSSVSSQKQLGGNTTPVVQQKPPKYTLAENGSSLQLQHNRSTPGVREARR